MDKGYSELWKLFYNCSDDDKYRAALAYTIGYLGSYFKDKDTISKNELLEVLSVKFKED